MELWEKYAQKYTEVRSKYRSDMSNEELEAVFAQMDDVWYAFRSALERKYLYGYSRAVLDSAWHIADVYGDLDYELTEKFYRKVKNLIDTVKEETRV